MRWVLGLGFVFVVAGCQGEPAAPDAHRSDSGPGGGPGQVQCGGPPIYPDCSLTCGNGHVDMCTRTYMITQHCLESVSVQEACDTAAPLDCSSLGYFGSGTATCTSCLSFADTSCDACAPGSLACTNNPLQRVRGLSVSGTLIAQPATTSIALFDATAVLGTSVQLAATSLTATPTGWLVSSPQGIQSLAFDGTLGAEHAALGAGATVAPGPVAGHYLELWRQGAMQPVRAILHDATGATVGAAFDTFMSDTGGELAATSDGVHAFLGLDGKLAIIGDDGSVVITPNQFPGFSRATLTRATSSWYVAAEAGDWSAQRFDSAGAPVGTALHIAGSASSFLADGDDLLVVTEGPSTLVHPGLVKVVRYVAAGTAGTPITVGADRVPGVLAELAHLGSDLVVSWSGPEGTNIARVTAP